MNNELDWFEEAAWEAFQEAALDKYDFTTCQRPDGSYYGTGGTCRKGSPVSGGVPEKEKKMAGMRAKDIKNRGGESVGSSSDVKKLRKDMIGARDAEAKAKKARKEAEGGTDKAKAKETRAAHIQAKKDMKAATEKFQKAQASAGDVKRLGRESERAKASDKELKDALKSKQLSPTKKAAVERELRLRAAGSPMAAKKDPFAKQNAFAKKEQERLTKKYANKKPDGGLTEAQVRAGGGRLD